MKKLSVKEIFEKRIQDTEITMIASSHEPFSFFEEYDAKTYDKLYEVYILLFKMFDKQFNEIGGYIHTFHTYGQLTNDEKNDVMQQWIKSYNNCIKYLENRTNEMSTKYDIKPVEFFEEC